MLFGVIIAGCGGKDGGAADNGDDVTQTEAETTSKFSDYASKYLTFDDPVVPDDTFGGLEFAILGIGDEPPKDEETGDVVEDAIYLSRRAVEERLDIDIVYKMIPSVVDTEPTLKKAVMSGDSAYDLAINHCIHAIPDIIKQKLVHDWNRVPNVDFTKPYWNQSMNETLSVNGVLPIANGNYFITSPMCIFFNKQIHKDYNIENLYTLVDDGKWTLDKFCSISKMVSADLNGDGVYGVEDLYGMIGMADYQFMGFLAGCNQFVVEKTKMTFRPSPSTTRRHLIYLRSFMTLFTEQMPQKSGNTAPIRRPGYPLPTITRCLKSREDSDTLRITARWRRISNYPLPEI